MWRVVRPIAPRRPQYDAESTHPRLQTTVVNPFRLIVVYLLLCFLFYVYIHCYLGDWFKSRQHYDGDHLSPKFATNEMKSNSFLSQNKPVDETKGKLALKQEKKLQGRINENTMGRGYQGNTSPVQSIFNKSRHRVNALGVRATLQGLSTLNDKNREREILRNLWMQWRRYVETSFDWKGMLRSCKSDMVWISHKPSTDHLTSAVTSNIISTNIQPAGEISSMWIQSRTANGDVKTMGGDAWRVYIRGPSALVAKVIDHNNGTYEALFLVVESGDYTVHVILDFSLCNGLRDPPPDWFIQGNAQGKYQKDDTLGPLDDFLLQRLKWSEALIINVPRARVVYPQGSFADLSPACRRSCRSLWNPYGRWVKGNTWIPYFSAGPTSWQSVDNSLTPSGTLWVYGDSVAKNLVLSARKRALCNQLYKQCAYSYNWIYPVLAGEQKAIVQNDDLDFDEERVINTIREVLLHPEMNHNSTLLLNLGLHFVMTLNFTTYQRLIDHVIYMLTQKRPGEEDSLWYKAQVVWRTTTAIYKENAKVKNSTHFRFLTPQRILLFNAYSTWAMCQAGIPVVDVHPITASYPYGPIDVVHYYGFVTHPLEQTLEYYKLNGELKNNKFTKVCLT